VPASDCLSAETIECLEQKCGTIDGAALFALGSNAVGDELHAWGVVDISGQGSMEVYVPPERERVIWARIATYHGCEAEAEAQGKELDLGDSDDFLGGEPYTRTHYVTALKLKRAHKMTVGNVEKQCGLPRKRAYRIYRQLKADAVLLDGGDIPRPALGFMWDPVERERDGYKLIRR
jgi:hypothetical protein